VIGAAVNEVTRVEDQCRQLGQPLLVTGAFAACGCSNLVSLGSYRLRDVRDPVELFGLPPGGIDLIAIDPSLCR
jgi:class 3 adenylate cyclase